MSDQPKVVYFHVGLGKVASTYLQYRFFPKLRGVYYIQRTRYRQYHDIIQNSDYGKYLISREFDRQLEEKVRQFTSQYPGGKFIIMLRRHDSWIASQYRRFVKNGMYMSFEEFIDIEGDNGFWKIGQMTFHPMLQMIEQVSGTRPMVLFHEDLKKDPISFFDQIALFTGATYKKADISLKPVHRSYSEKQLKVIRKLKLYDREPHGDMRDPIHWMRRRWRFLVCYAILYPTRLLPDRWAPKEDLIDKDALQRVRTFFEDDWQKCISYAEAAIPVRDRQITEPNE